MITLVRWPLLATLALLICGPMGSAQNRQQPRRPMSLADLKDTTVDGTVKGVQGNVLQVEATTGHKYAILIVPNQSKLGLSGLAKPDFLKPGMLVSFSAILPEDKKAEVESPPTELTIIAPSEGNTPGMFEDKDKEGNYFIRATVKSFKDGKLSVAAAGRQVTVPVGADMDIKVASDNLSYIRAGDTIKVRGKEVQAPKSEGNNVIDGQVVGQEIDIKLQDTLTAATFSRKKPK
jgi:hypothetical protein